MPRHASFTNIPRLVLPVVVDIGNPNYDPGVPHLQLYEYWNVGRFLYFRFDERNWIPKRALTQYNREWPHHQVGLHQATEARRIFFWVRDNTQQNFFQGLSDIVSAWLNDTISGQHYRLQYSSRRRAYDQSVARARASNHIPPPRMELNIATTRFPRGPGTIPNEDHQADGIPDPNFVPAPPPPRSARHSHQPNDPPSPPPLIDNIPHVYLNRYLPFFQAFVTRPACVKHAWKYNLEFIDEELREGWNAENPAGDPAVPLFEGLAAVGRDLAATMLVHILQQRRQR